MKWRCEPGKHVIEPSFDILLHKRKIELSDNSKHSHTVEWDFGDGHTSSESNPVHTYKKKGEYIITQKCSNHCETVYFKRKIIVK